MKNLLLVIIIATTSITWGQDAKFSNQTIQKFADAYKEVRKENMTYQLNMINVIKDAGLTSEEFTDIHVIMNNPNTDNKPSDAKIRMYQDALKNIESLQTNIQANIEELIVKNGLKVETYQAIAKAAKNDKSLTDKIQKLIN